MPIEQPELAKPDYQNQKIFSPQLPEHLNEAAQKLNQDYLNWRHGILIRRYKSDCYSEGDEVEEEKINNIDHTAEKGWPPFDQLPKADFFERNILPTILTMSQDPIHFEKIGHDAIETLELLLTAELSPYTHRVSKNLLKYFFADHAVNNMPGAYVIGSQAAIGQFQYFYQNYSPSFVKAVAIHQAWQNDLYYSFDDSYTHNTYAIESIFLPPLEGLPNVDRDRLLEVFVEYGGEKDSHIFLRNGSRVVKAFHTRQKEHLLPYYFALAHCTPSLDFPEKKCEKFPLFEEKEVIEELEAFDRLTEFKNELFELAKYLLEQKSQTAVPIRCKPSFLEKHRSVQFINDFVILPDLISHLRAEKYSDDKIKYILRLVIDNPFLKEHAFDIIQNYSTIEKNVPEGLDTVLKTEMPEFFTSPRCFRRFIASITTEHLKIQNKKAYFEVGKKLIYEYRDDAAPYFDLSEINPNLLSLADLDDTQFSQEIEKIRSVLAHCPSTNTKGPQTIIIAAYLRFWGESEFDKFLNGIEYLLEEFQGRAEKKSQLKQSPPDLNILNQAVQRYSVMAEMDYRNRFKLAKNMPYRDQAAILFHFGFEADDPYLNEKYSKYITLIEKGLHHVIAALVVLNEANLSLDMRRIKELALPVEEKKAAHLVDTVIKIRSGLQSIFQPTNEYAQNAISPRPKLSQNLTLNELRGQLQVLENLACDPETKNLAPYQELKKEIETAINLAKFEQVVSFGILNQDLEINKTPLLTTANPHTKMIIAFYSTLLAIGAISPERLSLSTLSPLKLPNMEKNSIISNSWLIADLRKYETSLRKNLNQIVPQVENLILAARADHPGLMAVGAKFHTKFAMSHDIFNFILNLFGLSNTAFHLIDADKTLVVPPLPSSTELIMLTFILEKFGLLAESQIQLAIGDQLNPKLAAIVGASMLLSTERAVIYKKGAFKTTHDLQTGARIMAYDDGIREQGLPYDIPEAVGRTDILGRRSIGDIYRYPILGTLGSHDQRGKFFAPIMAEYCKQFLKILDPTLLQVLYQSSWIYDQKQPNDPLENHEEMIEKFTQAWIENARTIDFGLIGKVNHLIQEAAAKIAALKKQIIAQDPEEYHKLLTF